MGVCMLQLYGSSAESVGDIGQGEVGESVVEGEFAGPVVVGATGVADGRLGLVVAAVNSSGAAAAAGAALVGNEEAVVLARGGKLDQGLDLGAVGTAASALEARAHGWPNASSSRLARWMSRSSLRMSSGSGIHFAERLSHHGGGSQREFRCQGRLPAASNWRTVAWRTLSMACTRNLAAKSDRRRLPVLKPWQGNASAPQLPDTGLKSTSRCRLAHGMRRLESQPPGGSGPVRYRHPSRN